MNYIGIDLGRRTSTISATDHKGARLKGIPSKIENSAFQFSNLVSLAKSKRGEVRIAIETGNSAFTYAREMQKAGGQLYVVNPYQNALIRESRKKNDDRDAAQLNEQLRKDMFPKHGVYVPTEKEESLRHLNSYREYLLGEWTSLINRALRVADRHALYFEAGQLKSKIHWEKLTSVASSWSEVDRFLIEQYEEDYKRLSLRLKAVGQKILDLTQQLHGEELSLLSSLKGVGPTISCSFLARVCNVERFKTSRQLTCYLGLTPITRESGKKKGRGAISKAGDAKLRGKILLAADSFIRWAPDTDPLLLWHKEISRRRGWEKARVALARKLVAIMYAMIKTKKKYDPELLKKHLRITVKTTVSN